MTPAWTRWDYWRESVAIYKDRRIVAILFLGFSSGLPIMLVASTLSAWLREEDVSRAAIGLFGFVFAPYTFKFAWAPLVDRMALPPLTTIFGRRRGWMLAAQAGLVVSIFALGQQDPAAGLWWVAAWALAVGFFSATQDIVIDAYRIDILPEEELGAGAAVVVLGYRVAMFVATAGALFLAEYFGWAVSYSTMAALMAVGVATVLLIEEPAGSRTDLEEADIGADRIARYARGDFSAHRGMGGWLLAIVLYFGIFEPLSWLFAVAGPLAPALSGAMIALSLANLAVVALGAWIARRLWRLEPDAASAMKDFCLLALLWAIARVLLWGLGSENAVLMPELDAYLTLAALWLISSTIVAPLGGEIEFATMAAPIWLNVVGFWLEFFMILIAYGQVSFGRRAIANFGATPVECERRAHLWVRSAVIGPFWDYFERHGVKIAIVVLALISVYKASDVVLTLLANPFYIDMGFSKAQIAWTSNTFGLWMTLLGSMAGGALLHRIGMLRALLAAAVLMAGSNLMFAVMALVGGGPGGEPAPEGSEAGAALMALFHLVIMIENLTGGLGTAIFVGFLSSLCNVHFSAVQYALLTSFMQLLGKFVIVPASGFYADATGWFWFFATSTLFALPALALIAWLWRMGFGVEAEKRGDAAGGAALTSA